MEKVTIYMNGVFGVKAIEAKLIAHGTKEYAQYRAAPFVHYIEKGKRKPTGVVIGYDPFIVIARGWGLPQPADPFQNVPANVYGVRCRQTRYGSYDRAWKLEFNRALAGMGLDIIADYRADKAESEVA